MPGLEIQACIPRALETEAGGSQSHTTYDCTGPRRCQCRHRITPGELDAYATFEASAAPFQL